MYHKFFELKEPAFSIAVNPRFLYMSKQHREALIHLLYGVKGGGFVMLSGEVGTGKTTIIQRLLKRMPEKTDIAIVLNPMADATDMIYTICDELGVAYPPPEKSVQAGRSHLKAVTDALYEYLLENHRDGRNTVLLIDEAQLLSAESLEQIRLLTNLETTTKKLLQIILVGQPELNTLLAEPRLRQLAQRITARFHLRPLNLEETEAYIQHRWTIAGGELRKLPFTPGIIRSIHRIAEGIPRKINLLCERALIGAYAHSQVTVSQSILDMAEKEVLGDPIGLVPAPSKLTEKTKPPMNPFYWAIGLGALCTILLISLLTVLFVRPSNLSSDTIAATDLKSTQAANQTIGAEIISTQVDSSVSKETVAQVRQSLKAVSSDDAMIDNRQRAFEVFSQHLGFAELGESICDEANFQLKTCVTQQAQAWQEVLNTNRPAVLTLISDEKFLYYAVLIGVDGKQGRFINGKGETLSLALSDLGDYWNGEYVYVWSKPPGFKNALVLGQNNPTIAWVAEQFALLDNQSQPLTQKTYTEELRERVKIFQRNHGLEADGILGAMTLLKLNEVLNRDKLLSRTSLAGVK